MAHRSDVDAAHARIAALERELASARARDRRPLRCAGCRIPFEPDDLAAGVLRCRGCGAAVEIGQPPRSRRKPPEVQLDEGAEHLRIWWRWSWSPGALAFALVLTAIAGWLAWSATDPASQGTRIGLLICSLVMVAVAGYDTYAHRRNRTEVDVSAERIEVQHGPVPYSINRVVERAEVAQIYVEPRSGRYGTRFAVAALLTSGDRRLLVTNLEADRAFYLEQELERRLDLADLPVAGEAAPPRL